MKSNWEKFEEDCRNWLEDNFGDLVSFRHYGGSNSGMSDIEVVCPNGVSFFIEVKSPESQCSQFVLLPDEASETFIYSPQNKLEMNPFTQHILDYMNADFTRFCNPGSKGVHLDPNLSEAAGHIRYQHMVKKVELFISKGDNGYVLIPLSFIGFYFDIEAVFRNKKSGSSPIPKKDEGIINAWLSEKYSTVCTRIFDDKFATVVKHELLNKEFEINGRRYMFKHDGNGMMVMRKLSDTNNSNVIFTIKLKKDVNGLPKEYFQSFLKLLSR